MARVRSVLLIAAFGLAAVHLRQPAFVPPPLRHAAPAVIPAVAMLGAAPAFADEIGDAAKKLSDKAWPYLNEIDWTSPLFSKKPGTASAIEWTNAVEKAIDMGAAMDPTLLKAGVLAHHNAIAPILKTGGTIRKSDFEAVNAAIGRMIASVPEAKTVGVYEAFSKVVSPDVPAYLMSTVKAKDAKAAYEAFLEFKDVVKRHPIAAKAATSSVSGAKIDAAAAKLSAAAYPYMKEIDWTSDLFAKNPGNTGPVQVLKAIDKALVMGAAMDGAALQEAGKAHTDAILNMDKKGVPSLADFTAINAGIGKMVASVPASKTMDVYNAFAGIVAPPVPAYLMSTVKAADAAAAYKAFLEFKDVVKATR